MTCADRWLKQAKSLQLLYQAAPSHAQLMCGDACKGLMNYQGRQDKPLMKTVTGPLMRRRVVYSKGLSGSQKSWALCTGGSP